MNKIKLTEEAVFKLDTSLRERKLDTFINKRTIPIQFDDVKIAVDLETDILEVKFFNRGLLIASSTDTIPNLHQIKTATFSIGHDAILGFLKITLVETI